MSEIRQKCCWECRQLVYRAAEQDWSDVTPGSDAALYCARGIWDVDFFADNQDTFRTKILTARTCDQFEEMAE